MSENHDTTADTPFDPAHHQRLLQKGARALGIPLDAWQVEAFERYLQLLMTWNQKVNLTAITDYEEIQVKHFLDSLVGLPVVLEEMGHDLPLTEALSLADIGTGAGFPGIPLKLAAPALTVTLIDGTGKKINFLRDVITSLDLTGITTVQGRAEELGRQAGYREQFDLVTARAVAPLNTLVEYLLPLVCVGGLAVIYKGAGATDEFVDARKAVETLGGETVRLAPLDVPFLEGMRYLILIRKQRSTPRQYPRGQGLARKKPL